MVTMLVPLTEKIPIFTDFFKKTLPILAKTRAFVVRKITPFSDFNESYIA